MRKTEPEVYLIGQTSINESHLYDFLDDEAYSSYHVDNCTSDPEVIVEVMGRNCYRSFVPGANPNVKKVRKGNKEYLENILSSGHGSVLEHSTLNFIFTNVSRVFTHELVRHRVGTAISQESLRFVRLNGIGFWTPSCFEDDSWAEDKIKEVIEYLENVQKDFSDHYKLDNETDFHRKKTITSAMRRLAPEGLSTTIGWSCNFRSLFNIIQKRTDPAAEEEIRLVFSKVAEIVKKKFPNVFGGLVGIEIDGIKHYLSPYGEI